MHSGLHAVGLLQSRAAYQMRRHLSLGWCPHQGAQLLIPGNQEGRTGPCYQPSHLIHPQLPGKQRQEKAGKGLLGLSPSPAGRAKPSSGEPSKSQVSKEAVRSVRRRKTSSGNSEAARAVRQAGQRWGRACLMGGSSTSLQGASWPLMPGGRVQTQATREGAGGAGARFRAPWGPGWGTAPLGDPKGTW